MMIIRGVNVFPTQIEEEVVKIDSFSENYEIHLSRQGNMDNLEVHIELRPDYAHIDDQETQQLVNKLRHHVKSSIGISIAVKVREVGSISRSEGKAKRVFDERTIA